MPPTLLCFWVYYSYVIASTRSNPENITVCMEYFVYIMANCKNGTLYVGVTRDLIRRVYEHKNGLVEGFTQKYKIHNLVYYEKTSSIEGAIGREKILKGGSRAAKLALIESFNPNWRDLYPQLLV